MSIRVDDNRRQLTLWDSREEALKMIAQQLLGRWTARLHDGCKGWLLVEAAGQRYDQTGAIDAATQVHKTAWPTPLLVRDMGRDDDDGTLHITFDNATGVRARVDSHLTKQGSRVFAATVSCPALSASATTSDARDLAYSLLAAADQAEKPSIDQR